MIIVETRPFQRVREIYFTENEFGELNYALFHRPKLGVVIPGTGGVRKLRWRLQGRGKRGGIRVDLLR
ncbi:MAG: addiction module toxin RelE [Proteobacteria bacterium]|nr:addiction module toxin RelE [Pseudomonadota bacterium]